MTVYQLYIESGPKHRKTMVHVPELLGCVATGPTTAETIAETPAAITTFLRFLDRCGEPNNALAPFKTEVAEHITEGEWLGNGSPYLTFATDLDPLTEADINRYLNRFSTLCGELGHWAAGQSAAELDSVPENGRTNRAILLHIIGPVGSYLFAALSGAPGFSRIHGLTEREELSFPEAFQQLDDQVRARVAATTAIERNAVRELTSRTYTLRKAFRRMLEHSWEHYAELARRSSGPNI